MVGILERTLGGWKSLGALEHTVRLKQENTGSDQSFHNITLAAKQRTCGILELENRRG